MKAWITRKGLKIIRVLTGRSNVFLITNGCSNILIDTSPGNKWNHFQKSLRENNIGHLDCLVLTHSHYDHAGNAARIKDRFGCPVMIHRAEMHNLQTGEITSPKGTNPATRFIVKNLAPRFENRLKCEPCQPDVIIDEEHDLNSYGINARIIHTPGHSPGSVSIIVDDEIALVGDTLFGVFRWSVFPPYADNVEQMIKSWKDLLKTNCNVFLPSHGGSKNRDQLLREYIQRGRDDQIL